MVYQIPLVKRTNGHSPVATQWCIGRASDSAKRSQLQICVANCQILGPHRIVFTLHCSSCMNGYLAVDSGGYLCIIVFTHYLVLDDSQRSRDGFQLDRSARKKIVKSLKQSWVLNTVLYMNVPFTEKDNYVCVYGKRDDTLTDTLIHCMEQTKMEWNTNCIWRLSFPWLGVL